MVANDSHTNNTKTQQTSAPAIKQTFAPLNWTPTDEYSTDPNPAALPAWTSSRDAAAPATRRRR